MVFSALNSVPSPKNVNVVVVGPAPFPKKENASGFSFCDQAAKSWKLDNVKGATRNLIKAALIDKGQMTKSGDVDTIREVLENIDLPCDASRDWFKHTARQGVLWLNTSLTCTEETDDHDDKKIHEQQWAPVVEEIIRAIFNSKISDSEGDISAVVFLILGKNSPHFKPLVEKVHSEVMGVVPIEFIDGMSPVLETFHNVNYLSQVNAALEKNQTPTIDWLPESAGDDDYMDDEEEDDEEGTGEDSHVEEAKHVSAKFDSHDDEAITDDAPPRDIDEEEPRKVLAYLVPEDGVKVALVDHEQFILGRTSLSIKDLSVSRKQASIVAELRNGKVFIELTPLGTNPMHLTKKGEESEQLQTSVPVNLHHGDEADKKRKAAASKPKPAQKKKQKKDQFSDDFDMDDELYGEDNSDDDYVPPDDDQDDDYSPPATRSSSKPKCKYWDECYRTNPQHLEEFRHPA
eukprot:gene6800-7905_t